MRLGVILGVGLGVGSGVSAGVSGSGAGSGVILGVRSDGSITGSLGVVLRFCQGVSIGVGSINGIEFRVVACLVTLRTAALA